MLGAYKWFLRNFGNKALCKCNIVPSINLTCFRMRALYLVFQNECNIVLVKLKFVVFSLIKKITISKNSYKVTKVFKNFNTERTNYIFLFIF